MLLKFAKTTLPAQGGLQPIPIRRCNYMAQSCYLLPGPPLSLQAPGAPGTPDLGFRWSRDVLGVLVSRLGESECVAPEDGHEDGGVVASQTLDLGSDTPAPTGLRDNG